MCLVFPFYITSSELFPHTHTRENIRLGINKIKSTGVGYGSRTVESMNMTIKYYNVRMALTFLCRFLSFYFLHSYFGDGVSICLSF